VISDDRVANPGARSENIDVDDEVSTGEARKKEDRRDRQRARPGSVDPHCEVNMSRPEDIAA
jgi:hypothetical protein